jgi:prepilin-type N-terminal cleavage/methylation domain-containing protein
MHSRQQYTSAPAAGRRRPAFTLLEVVVVIAIILLLVSLMVIFFPSIEQRERSYAGASQMQQWLQTAKYRALQERAPRGVRFYANYVWLTDKNLVPHKWYTNITTAQYIEQPEDFTGGFVSSQTDPTQNPQGATYLPQTQLTLWWDPNTGAGDVSGGFPYCYDPSLWPVQKMDYIQVQGSGLMHQIIDIQLFPPLPPLTNPPAPYKAIYATLTLASPLPNLIYQTGNGNPPQGSNYRIVRQPRVLGDDVLEFPNGIGVDLTEANAPPPPPPPPPNPPAVPYLVGYDQPLPTPYFPAFYQPLPISPGTNPNNTVDTIDLLFAPSGALLGNYGTDKLIFWVRDITDESSIYFGNPSLVVVYPRSGLVASFDLDLRAKTNNSYSPYDLIGQ